MFSDKERIFLNIQGKEKSDIKIKQTEDSFGFSVVQSFNKIDLISGIGTKRVGKIAQMFFFADAGNSGRDIPDSVFKIMKFTSSGQTIVDRIHG